LGTNQLKLQAFFTDKHNTLSKLELMDSLKQGVEGAYNISDVRGTGLRDALVGKASALQAPGVGLVFQALPTSSRFSIANDEFRVTMALHMVTEWKHMAGLLNLHPKHTGCACKLLKPDTLMSEPHLACCNEGSFRIRRHDGINIQLAQALRGGDNTSVKFHEPTAFIRERSSLEADRR
jgi:hypothetical protein